MTWMTGRQKWGSKYQLSLGSYHFSSYTLLWGVPPQIGSKRFQEIVLSWLTMQKFIFLRTTIGLNPKGGVLSTIDPMGMCRQHHWTWVAKSAYCIGNCIWMTPYKMQYIVWYVNGSFFKIFPNHDFERKKNKNILDKSGDFAHNLAQNWSDW